MESETMKKLLLAVFAVLWVIGLSHPVSASPYTYKNAPASFSYSSYSIVNGVNVDIYNSKGALISSGLAGEAALAGTGANYGKTLYSFCVDIFDNLQNRGTLTKPTSITDSRITGTNLNQAVLNQISALIANAYAKIGTSADVYQKGRKTYANVLSAATQVAIWTVEYAGLGYTFKSSSSAVNDLATSLVKTFSQSSGVPGLTVLAHAGNQSQAFLVPEPAAILLILSAFGGFLLMRWRRARQQGALPAQS